ncbi:phage major capsid protein [Lachnospiraceae bacterium KM106-2]|nr:phage major capsid protein [Lachnospiraceae bacterium KM106-2]
MNTKQLTEKKNELIEQMEQLIDTAEMERRNFSDDEDTTYQALETELKAVIKELSETRNYEEYKENTNMETRNYTQELLNGKSVELRAMDTTNKGEVVPTKLFEQIAKKVMEKSGIVAEVKIIESVGDIEFLVEGQIGEACFLSETGSAAPKDLDGFDKVKLTDKRLATAIIVSKKLLNNNHAITESYLADIIAERMANALEKELLSVSSSENGFTNTLLTDTNAETGSLNIDSIMQLITSMKEAHLKGAKLIMNRANFTKLSTLKDANNHFYVVPTYDHATGAPIYSILGVQIKISEYAPADKIVLVNVSDAGIMKQSGGLKLTPLLEKYAENGQVAILAEQFVDFGILNRDCVKVLNIQTSRSKAA